MKSYNLIYLCAITLAVLIYSCGKEPTCTDGIQNQGETGVDCFVVDDCNIETICICCDSLGILSANCFDEVQNGNETGIDCGGNCDPCVNTADCFDGLQNQNETGVDCGGTCENTFGFTCVGDTTGGGTTDPCDDLMNVFDYTEDGVAVLNPISGAVSNGPFLAISASLVSTLSISISNNSVAVGNYKLDGAQIIVSTTDAVTSLVYGTSSPGFSGSVTVSAVESLTNCNYISGSFDFTIAEPGGLTKTFIGTFTELVY